MGKNSYEISFILMPILFFWNLNPVIAQNTLNYSFIRNDSIKYSVWHVTNTDNQGQLISYKYEISVKLSDSKLTMLKSITYQKWMQMLQNDSTDWAADLILYSIYKKDAVIFNAIITNRKEWIPQQKKKDLTYWKENIKN